MAKTDLEIAQECVMEPIAAVAKKIGIEEADLEFYGKYKAKLNVTLNEYKDLPDGKLILVTAISRIGRWFASHRKKSNDRIA